MNKRIRVVLVDDNDDFRVSASRFLRAQKSCELVGLAASGEEALECVAALRPDLILLDIAMPGCGGLDVARRLKSRETAAPRIVMVTVHDDASYRLAAREAGADGFISKGDFTLQILSLLHELAELPREPLGERE